MTTAGGSEHGLADLVHLPEMDTEYKFNNWTGEEIYPDEEDEYRERVAGIHCFYLKGSGGSETLGADFKELASNGGSSSIPVEDLCALRVHVCHWPTKTHLLLSGSALGS